jgi:hypothetical protein
MGYGIRPKFWYHCEQVQLAAIDASADTMTVRRGCCGTRPQAFIAGESRAAAHAVEGPWGRDNHLMGFYNFATHCPRDRQGNTRADLLIDDLAEWFGRDGRLAAFDGIGFDVMHNQTRGVMNGWRTFGLLWQPDEYIFYLMAFRTSPNTSPLRI